jgi:hypothetical protein
MKFRIYVTRVDENNVGRIEVADLRQGPDHTQKRKEQGGRPEIWEAGTTAL